jgi:hypothetical protein
LFDSDGKAFLGHGGREWRWDAPRYDSSYSAGRQKKRKREDPPQTNRQEEFGGGRRLCRAIGTIDRGAQSDGVSQNITTQSPVNALSSATTTTPGTSGATMRVLSIWPASWSDVEYVQGIVTA